DGIRDFHVTGVQTCALPISAEVTREERTAPAEWARAAFEVSGSPLLRGLAEATRTALRRLAEALLTGLTRLTEALLTGLGGLTRSEERRVGKEWRSRRAPDR